MAITPLESESIEIIREVASQCGNPVMLYSIGKDSAVMLHLAMKAFYPFDMFDNLLLYNYFLHVRDDF